MIADPARLLAEALAPAGQTAPDEIGNRILDGALQLVAASGVRHLTMDDVASRARVGRMTVYRRFGTRQALLDALALREARRCLDEIAGSFRFDDPFDQRAADLFVAVIRVIREQPLLARLARVEPEALLTELTRDDSEVFDLVRSFLVAQVGAAQGAGELFEADPEVLAELALRLGASFVLIPDGVFTRRTESDAREMIRQLLRPLVSAGAGQRP